MRLLSRNACAKSGDEGNDYAVEVTLAWTGACEMFWGRTGVKPDMYLRFWNTRRRGTGGL